MEDLTNKESYKMNIFACTAMGAGSIIGAGVFGSLPAAAAYIGTGMVIAYIFAIAVTFCRYLPTMVTSSVIPASFNHYSHVTRLVNPKLGYLLVIQSFAFAIHIANLSQLAAEYINSVIPVNVKIFAFVLVIANAILTCYGAQASAKAQNIMVVVLVAILIMFVIFGIPNIKPEFLTFKEIIAPEDMTISKLGAAVALLSNSLVGGYMVMNMAGEIKNPERDIPLSFSISTILCGILFIAITIVMLGVMNVEEANSLADVAAVFMSKSQHFIFVLVGAFLAIVTTMNGIFASATRQISEVAKDKVIPEIFAKESKYNVSVASVFALTIPACLIILLELTVVQLFSANAFIMAICGIAILIPPLRVYKVYPNGYKNSYLKLTPTLIWIITILGIIAGVWEASSLAIEMDKEITIALVSMIVVFYGYYLIRRSYLNKKGIDMEGIMSNPLDRWTEMEEKLDLK